MAFKLIRYGQFNKLEEWIDDCREESEESGEPVCMVLDGLTGAGKSTLVKNYAAAHPRRLEGEKTKVPVLYLETPSPASIKSLSTRMLRGLGDPGAGKGANWEMADRIIHFLEDCEVQLVILDDFHHLVDHNTNHVLYSVADWLKVIIKRVEIPFLITGIDGKIRRIMEVNSQLARLFVWQELKPFALDLRDMESVKNFGAFITFIKYTFDITLPGSDAISELELLHRIHYATDGVMGHMMYLFRRAALISKRMETGGEISLEILTQAFEERLREYVSKPNPFAFTPDKTFVPPVIGVKVDGSGKKKRGRGRRKGPKASEVLKTK